MQETPDAAHHQVEPVMTAGRAIFGEHDPSSVPLRKAHFGTAGVQLVNQDVNLHQTTPSPRSFHPYLQHQIFDENAQPIERGASTVTRHNPSASRPGSSLKKAAAPRVNVRLVPQNSRTAARVRNAGYNPKLELSTPLSKRVGFFLGHLAKKWSNVSGINSLSLRLVVSPARQLEEHVSLRSLESYFTTATKMAAGPSPTPTGAGAVTPPSPSAILQLHYLLVEDLECDHNTAASHTTPARESPWGPEENSLFDAFAATGLDQLPCAIFSDLPHSLPPSNVPPISVQQVDVQPVQEPKKGRKRASLTSGVASNRNDTFVNAATVEICTPAPVKQRTTSFCSSVSTTTSSSSSPSIDSSADRSRSVVGPKPALGQEKKRRRIRPTLLSAGQAVSSSPSFTMAHCGIGSFTSESSRQSCFSNSGDDSGQ